MKRPSFQFYPGDWQSNSNLRRCTDAEQGVWMRVLCVLHDQDEYGIVRWPLKELAQAANCTVAILKSLVKKGVLKGADGGEQVEEFVYVPRSARKDGDPVTLVPTQDGPVWYSSRFVKDEYVRTIRGAGTRFGDGDGEAPKDAPNKSPNRAPKPSPKPPIGEGQGDGPSSSSSSSPSGKDYSVLRTDAEASAMAAKDAIWKLGIPWMVDRGSDEKKVRSMVGNVVRQLGDDEAWAVVQDCMHEQAVEPVAWLAGALNKRMAVTKGGAKGMSKAQQVTQGVKDLGARTAALAAQMGMVDEGEVAQPHFALQDDNTFDME